MRNRLHEIDDFAARAIAEALKLNTTLTTLVLSENQIGDAGAQSIAEALKVNTTLTELRLEFNQIGDAGAQAIAEALKVNTKLGTLYLRQNQIGEVGALAIAEALRVNKTLALLYLESNFLTKAEIIALRQTGNTCHLKALDNQRTRSPAEQAAVAKNQQLRTELAAKEQELQQLRSDLKSALDRIDALERHQPADGFASNVDQPIPEVPLATLVSATKNFADDSLLGEGAFGRVYRASLPGPPVAIKKLSAESIKGYASFQSELDSLSKFRHRNIITILSYAKSHDAYCLVYEFMPNGSVRDRLSRKNNTPPLTWSQRHQIAADVDRGMHYVQTALPDQVLFHLDLKTDNVLLDAHFNAKVSDFGLVRAAEHLDDKSYLRTKVPQGTAPYMCPEFFEEGRMTVKTDVYAFGMILLELATAAKPGTRLKAETRKAVSNQKFIEMLDSALKPSDAEHQSITGIVTLALKCLDDIADERPSFGRLIATLDA
ncbi:TKL/IRAK protein kinase [Capsaspora owczarzaki ATCC 30864]|uniref:TKL/IRAK protein kinase n=1 Tax=Capsaspora owczarzaki (strain ATCC 30864) TaxID=595528 RepID=A0A0D2X2L4_CAPO3|nr:TKL/IRAK protein kinase [Capsaspora owczarzaki ATCC 30864]